MKTTFRTVLLYRRDGIVLLLKLIAFIITIAEPLLLNALGGRHTLEHRSGGRVNAD